MKNRKVTLSFADGMDAHGIALCVQTASQYESSVRLTDGVRRMNAKSIMGMMALGLALGDDVTIETDGPDEDAALEAMSAFLAGE
ncbi:MAG: HPr family phosphocarrier protein [Lachnospiraceae bacterium]|nr:HPr family phosphocarrier protein [Lachnospiraceae bacterium]